jgi:hypothetical protein
MRNPKNKTYKKPAAVSPLNLEQTLIKLATAYPNGITNSWYYQRTAHKISNAEINLILNASDNSFITFQNLIANNVEIQRLFRTNTDKIVSNWFNRLNMAMREINAAIKRKEIRIKRIKEHKAKRLAEEAKRRAKLRKQQEQEKKKAKRNFDLMRQLNLSADQKRIFKQLAK